MNEKEKEIEAKYLLREVEKEEKLKSTIYKPCYEYYLGNSVLSWIARVILLGTLILWLFCKFSYLDISSLVFITFGIAEIAFLETARQRERFNAFLELNEINKKEKI